MDGRELLYQLRMRLNEDLNSGFLDTKTSYTFLWDAARVFVERTNIKRASQSIATVSGQSLYTLNADFMKLYMMDTSNNFISTYKLSGSTQSQFIYFKEYDDIIYLNANSANGTPSWFCVIDGTTPSAVSGTATSTGVLSNNTTTLYDTSANFSSVSIGDTIHNTSDGSDGVVISVDSNTQLKAALFNGTNNYFTSGNAYYIQPQARFQLVLSQPPANSGDTITFYYIPSPNPVYSDFYTYGIPDRYMAAIIDYAAWLYKFRGREPSYADNWYQHFDAKCKQAARTLKSSINKKDMRVTFRKRL